MLTTTPVRPGGLVRIVPTEPLQQSGPTDIPDSASRASLGDADARAAALLADLPDAARLRLAEVRMDRGSVVAVMRVADGTVDVVFGRAEDAAAKGRALLTVLQGTDPSTLRSIDLSVPDVPIVRRR